MVASEPTEPRRRMPTRSGASLIAASHEPDRGPETLEDVAAGVQGCRRCDLWREATQGVPGEGPVRADGALSSQVVAGQRSSNAAVAGMMARRSDSS